MSPPFPGFYQLLLFLLGFIFCLSGAPWMVGRPTKRKENIGGMLFVTGTLFIGTAVMLGKAGVG